MGDTTNAIPCCCLLIVILFLAVFMFPSHNTTVHTYNTEEPEEVMGDFNVVNNRLTNGTFNTTNLNKTWDVVRYKNYSITPTDFIFVYNDKNTTKYDGDAGLEYSTFNDTNTGSTYRMNKDLTRAIAYTTKGKFDLKDGFNLTRYRSSGENYYTPDSETITLNNGTKIEALHIYDNLTLEQEKYFVDYEEQLYRYIQEQRLKDIDRDTASAVEWDSELDVQNRISSKESGGSFRGISSRGSYIYGHYD